MEFDMIIGSLTKLTIGAVLQSGTAGALVTNDGDGQKIIEQPFLVLREATREEFVRYNEEIGEPVDVEDSTLMNRPDARYYEISTD